MLDNSSRVWHETSVELTSIDLTDGPDRDAFVTFMTTEPFPMHASGPLAPKQVHARISRGDYSGADNAVHWLTSPTVGQLGIAHLQDLTDDSPMFDLRLAQRHRGKGLGTQALQAVTNHVFRSMPRVHRFEGVTRAENLPMRHAFLRVGFAKEAHYRQGWASSDGQLFDSVGYAILRQDWDNGTRSPVPWDDMPR